MTMLATRCIARRRSWALPHHFTGLGALPDSPLRARRPLVEEGQRRFAWGLSDGSSQTKKGPAPWESPPVNRTSDNAFESTICRGTTQKRQIWYDWYLHKTVVPQEDHTCAGKWIDSLDADTTSLRVPEPFREDPLAIFASNNPSPAAAKSCLELFILNTHSSWRDSEELRQSYQNHMPGTKSLRWLLTRYSSGDACQSHNLPRAIIHCLVGEGRDDLYERWKALSQVPRRCSGPEWTKDSLLRDYVEAKAFWSQEGINAALTAFHVALTAFHAAPHGHSLAYTAKWIFRQLWIGDTSGIDEALFEAFARWYANYIKDPCSRAFNSTKFTMRHPTKPDALPALQFMREAERLASNNSFVQTFLNPREGRTGSTLFWYIVHAAQMLHGQGLATASHEILDLGAATIPHYFKPGKLRNPYAAFDTRVAMSFGGINPKRDTAAGS